MQPLDDAAIDSWKQFNCCDFEIKECVQKYLISFQTRQTDNKSKIISTHQPSSHGLTHVAEAAPPSVSSIIKGHTCEQLTPPSKAEEGRGGGHPLPPARPQANPATSYCSPFTEQSPNMAISNSTTASKTGIMSPTSSYSESGFLLWVGGVRRWGVILIVVWDNSCKWHGSSWVHRLVEDSL